VLGSLPSELSPPAVGEVEAHERPACPEGGRASTGSAETMVEGVAGVKVTVGWGINSGAGRRLRPCPNDLPRSRVMGNSASSSEAGKVVVGGGCSGESSPSERSESPWSNGGAGGLE